MFEYISTSESTSNRGAIWIYLNVIFVNPELLSRNIYPYVLVDI